MASIVKPNDANDARGIAFARATQGKVGYYNYLRPMLETLEVGGRLDLDADDLVKMHKRENIETLPARIAAMQDGNTLDKDTQKDVSAIRSAIERELREVTKDAKATVVSFFPVTEDEDGNIVSVGYSVTRTR